MYDLCVIGGGWAGFNAALKGKKVGLKTCLIEQSLIGGTCLNYGCIPTKTIIQSIKFYSLAKKSSIFGININSPQIDLPGIQKRKEEIVNRLGQGMRFMLKGIDIVESEAKIISPNKISVDSGNIETKFIILATGSKPIELPSFRFNSKNILSSKEILNLKRIPDSILIIGGGVIGCEFAGIFSVLGSRVTIAEKMPQLLPNEDSEVARKLEVAFKKKNIEVLLNTDADTLKKEGYELILVCVGRIPFTERLGLKETGVKLGPKGNIIVDEYLKTNVPNILAAGDCTEKIMLAHFAAYQGRIAAENCLNTTKADNSIVPNCIFTDPEIASVGLNEGQAKSLNMDIGIKKFDFRASGMANIMDENDGFIKAIYEISSQKIIGASIIGPKATELIGIFGVALSSALKINDIRKTIFAHPTLSEGISELFDEDQ